jgi:hypothetical protein
MLNVERQFPMGGQVLLLSCVCAMLSGCGGPEPIEGLVPAYGTVTLDGKPLVDAQVTFDHPQHAETFGRTDSSGHYEMSYTMTQTGAFAGENAVSFTTADEEAEPPVPERVPDQYLFGNSTMTVTVTEDGAPYDFTLRSVAQPQ